MPVRLVLNVFCFLILIVYPNDDYLICELAQTYFGYGKANKGFLYLYHCNGI